jgi:glycosyltransferase involved in cell wall biosynthesis
MSRWKYAKPARFLAVSQFVARQLKDGGIPSEKIDVVYDGVEASAAAAEWSAECPAVALATADPGKGRDLVERAAQLSGVDVLFSDDLGRDLRKASMFIYISRSEGLGSAALLAMQMGVPVIASEVGGLAEVVKHGETGLLVKNEVHEIAQAMGRIRGDEAIARLFIERAKARIQAEFTLERMLERTLASYRRAGAR